MEKSKDCTEAFEIWCLFGYFNHSTQHDKL